MVEPAKTNNILRYVLCDAETQTFAMDMDSVYSIQRSDNLHLVQDSGRVIGWFPVRDERIPVFRLADRLTISSQERVALGGRVILMNPLSAQTGMWALVVDQVSQVYTTSTEALSYFPDVLGTSSEHFFQAVLRDGEKMYLLLDPTGIHPDRPGKIGGGYSGKIHTKSSRSNPKGRLTGISRRQSQPKQLLVFGLPGEMDQQQFAISITQVLEILAPLPVIPVPGASSYILGLINWRNRPVPLVDLTRRFELGQESEPDSTRLMIVRDTLRDSEQIFAFFVHPNIHMLRLPVKNSSISSQDAIPEKYVKGVVEIDGRVTVVPEVSRILST